MRRVLFLAHFERRSFFFGDLFRFCRLQCRHVLRGDEFKPSDQFETGESIDSSIISIDILP